MKVESLRLHLDNLATTLSSAGATAKIVGDLHAIAQSLKTFDAHELAAFSSFLTRAEEFDRTGQVPASGKKPAAAKSKKVEVDLSQIVQQIEDLKQVAGSRTISMDELNIRIEKLPLNSLTKATLDEVATKIHCVVRRKTGKGAPAKADVVESIKETIRGHLNFAQRILQ